MAEYDINYDDKRFQEVEADKKAALSENEKLYSGMVNESSKYYNAQIDASKEWEKTQTKLQNEKTDFAIEKIEQEKDQAKKDYTKEQSGAYVDWQKQKNDYGVTSEQQAAQGMANTGFSESSQVSMYNTYQNRVAKARESFNLAILNYNNAIKDARLQNNSTLAEIAYQALQKQLELSLQGFQYKNQLLLEQANKKLTIDQMYQERWQNVLDQINKENSLAEQVRQFNASLAEEQRQFNQQMAGRSSSSGGGGSSGGYRRRSTRKSSGSSDSSDAKINKSVSKSIGTDDVSVNLKSVLGLGKGPLSGDTLAEKANSGEITYAQFGNQIYVANNKPTSFGMASKNYKRFGG